MSTSFQMHGSIPYKELRELNLEPSAIIDFSATVNPFPLPPSVSVLFSSDDIAAYPDPESHNATAAIAVHHGLPPEWIVITTGLTEFLFILPRLFDRAIEFSPSYGDYRSAYHRYGRSLEAVTFPSTDAQFNTAIDILRKAAFDLLIICNPNNPTGTYVEVHHIQELCKVFKHAVICIDESYQEMGDDCASALPLIPQFDNLIILKSLTKPFGIGGVRAGYTISSGKTLPHIRPFLIPWGVSSLAQKIIPALFNAYSIFQQQWHSLHDEKRVMLQQLSANGILTSTGRCPFFLMKVDNAEQMRKTILAKYHIALRGCASFNMPEWIRVMPGLKENNEKLLTALYASSKG